MEIVLAIIVTAAVIFFGALISLGNERQRKAIDALREQAVLWAVQDLQIERERLARDVRVDDPLAWLNRTASKICGSGTNLQIVEVLDEPRALICVNGDRRGKVIFSPISPNEIRQSHRYKRSRLSQYSDRNPLHSLPQDRIVYEFSVLNCGILFDLELSLAWKGLTGQQTDRLERMWMYLVA